MLYERFWNWLTFDKRRNCKHEWRKVATSSKLIGYQIYDYIHSVCDICGKKEKSIDPERTHASDYLIW